MKKSYLLTAVCLLASFGLWTATVCFVDVQPIGPEASAVGLASVNRFFHNFTGVHMTLYTVTDWLGLVLFGFAGGFAFLGLAQWIRRKSILKVDHSILVLGGFYAVVIGAYLLFEVFVVNYRPVLIEGILEASYPSSTTMLTICVMSTTGMQLNTRIQNRTVKRCVLLAITGFAIFMVVGRLISGVHWLSDIIGGTLLSTGLVMLYRSLVSNGTELCR